MRTQKFLMGEKYFRHSVSRLPPLTLLGLGRGQPGGREDHAVRRALAVLALPFQPLPVGLAVVDEPRRRPV